MTDPLIPLKAQSSRLSTLLEKTTFKVPEFQRPYAWQAEQIEDFWDDISEAARGDNQFPHFFGTLLTAAPDHPLSGNALDVLDGQQRLATFTLLLIALDRHLEELESLDAAKSVRDAVATSRGKIRIVLHSGESRRLRLRSDDDHFLANLVAGNPGSSTGGGTLGRAFTRLHDHVAKRLETSENHLLELQRLTDAVLDRSVLIHAHCEAGFDSFVVFSTLNATGLRLTATQILRARSLGLVAQLPPPVGDETKEAWNEIEQLGDDSDRFLQAFLVIRTGERIQEKDIVRKFDQKVLRLSSQASPAEVEAHFASLARELKFLVPIYEDLAAGTWPATHAAPDAWHANRLNLLVKTLKVRQLLPLMIALASRRSLDFADVLQVLERASFVVLVCFDNQTRWGDRTFQLAASVYGNDLFVRRILGVRSGLLQTPTHGSSRETRGATPRETQVSREQGDANQVLPYDDQRLGFPKFAAHCAA